MGWKQEHPHLLECKHCGFQRTMIYTVPLSINNVCSVLFFHKVRLACVEMFDASVAKPAKVDGKIRQTHTVTSFVS